MQILNLSKQYEALVTALKTNIFYRARTRLTIFFTLAITILLILSSAFIYVIYSRQLSSDQQGNFSSNSSQDLFAKKQITNLGNSILLIDSLAILASIGTGWWLAGRTLRPIEQMVRSQKRFVANASHDLRTPLAIMRTSIELATRKNSHKNILYPVLDSNLEEIAYMEQLTNELLNETRIENLAINRRYQICNLVDISQAVIDNLSTYASSKHIKFAFTVKCSDCLVLGAKNDIRRALTNIIKNAVDYSSGKTVNVDITSNNKMLIWKCSNKGIAITSDDILNIFERNFRGKYAALNNRSGAGLGLAITKEIIELHKGTIAVHSSKNITTFEIHLPLNITSR